MAAAAVVLMVIDRGYRTIQLIVFVFCGCFDFDFAACLWKGKLDNYYGQCYQCLSSVVVFGSEFTGQMTDERNLHLLADTNTCSMFCRVHAAALLSLQERN